MDSSISCLSLRVAALLRGLVISPWASQPSWMAIGLGRGSARPILGLFPMSFGERAGAGVPLSMETWVLKLGLLVP